jgi:hypothetical protein
VTIIFLESDSEDDDEESPNNHVEDSPEIEVQKEAAQKESGDVNEETPNNHVEDSQSIEVQEEEAPKESKDVDKDTPRKDSPAIEVQEKEAQKESKDVDEETPNNDVDESPEIEVILCDWAKVIGCKCHWPKIPLVKCQEEGCDVVIHHLCQGIFENDFNFENHIPNKCVMHHPNSPFTAKKPDYHASSDDNSDDVDVGTPAPQRKGYVKSAKERAYEEHLAKQRAKQQDKVSKASGDSSSDDNDSETPPARHVRSSKEKVLAEKMARRSDKEKKDANKPALKV